ncbi:MULTISPECIES: FAD-dependent 5-carboxymethylaminomethyl-2-thiouridine(34) oxidoreductase MnmC [unclassified Thiomonas]|uniref:FAD-dependent 5-carboxymethylaminomethyl-2-thiouridine(34) oxidoreductase MnmC n=1 Tax=unclassified Thiomonas TaxID=2625466 RepID=UPI0004DBB70E|nr:MULTISPECIES: FAD-dependent 5-carboxymethylaminomethyl-2-thiouridine(34) oxidoreductase MnmC [unclassified Thiomonas]CDW94261.1 tRNA 5-methylaminomethyl-2-thiouridine biosynthesis bifunctional protein MnmC (Includes: tRNA (mnm(5)s(2)U34)-methyltransferase; FAD-dependent cmnm(5)s(2)U34 oxidoreductase) [Thiomonas sp. CB2]VDY04419.1 tRNA 5-methylaminomethyl-2-thiouridine biosynthesis bifunctional protein MnmC [Includes: tRNA (mnm(5)s(2)U34)-methyltransferase; FAD-dependent cmnm(5)s(2)U34 oxidored
MKPNAPPLLDPADLATNAEGQALSPRYGDVYASRAGALGQARGVYLQGCGLLDTPSRWAGREQFTVLETGFGLGVNFLATWAAWRADPQRCARLDYVSLELHPVRAADLLRHAPPELQPLAVELAAQWPSPVRGLHRIVLDEGRVSLLLAFGDAAELAPKLKLAADALYLDGFTPARNPAMWTPELFRAIARLSKPGARAASYTVAHAVQKGLSQAGFEVELPPGWGGKRQRLQATFNPLWKRTRHTLPAPWPAALPRHAVVIGAGLSGAACAHALAQRGWTVEVLESAPRPAGGGSAMPAGLAHLQPSADDNLLSRLTRAGMAALRRALPPEPAPPGPGCAQPAPRGGQENLGRPGVFLRHDLAQFGPATLTPADAADEKRMQDWRSSVHLPAEMAQWTEAGWQVDSAVLANQALCAAWLDSPRITLRRNTQAARLQRDGSVWRVLDAAGQELAHAPQIVLASALQTPALLAASGLIPSPDWLPLHPLRGQAQALPARLWPALQGLAQPWMGSGYVLRLPRAAARQLQQPGEEDWLLIGATFETEDQPLTPEQAWAHNRAGLSALTASPPLPEHTAALRHFVGTRAASADRLPYCGPIADLAPLLANPLHAAGKQLHELPRLPGVAVCAGMGSRGLTLAPLLAETLLAQIEGTPLPLETDLADSIDPARTALRRLRHAQT